jgi:cytochrome c-type biogenesis protein CcmF
MKARCCCGCSILSFFGAWSRPSAATCRHAARQCAGRAGLDRHAFLLFILITSNPFAAPRSGAARGPRPQPDPPGHRPRVHPPLLYLGYVGFSVCFSFAVAALIEGRIDAAWARWVRPWTLVAWMFLTGGIAMGSYWAYYELGWGGFWFWDPVENASFMPWLAGTALLHSAIVMEKRSALKIWTILLAILTFSLSLLGTFLVRSGVLTSVHCLRHRPDARRVHPVHPGRCSSAVRWRCLPGGRRRAAAGGICSSDLARGRAGAQQSVPDHGAATVLIGTLYPLVARGLHRRQDLGRRAVLQPHLRPADGAAAGRRAVRSAAGLETRRCLCCGAAADVCRRCAGGRLVTLPGPTAPPSRRLGIGSRPG